MSNKKKQATARDGKEMQEKRRYLKETLFQLETLKWVFLSFVLIIFGGFRYIKYLLLLMLVWDLLQTKYLFSLKWFKNLKYIVNSLIIFLFILNLKLFIPRNIVEAILVIILVYVFNQKYIKNYDKFRDLGGDTDEE